jgi:hypothetical protein
MEASADEVAGETEERLSSGWNKQGLFPLLGGSSYAASRPHETSSGISVTDLPTIDLKVRPTRSHLCDIAHGCVILSAQACKKSAFLFRTDGAAILNHKVFIKPRHLLEEGRLSFVDFRVPGCCSGCVAESSKVTYLYDITDPWGIE